MLLLNDLDKLSHDVLPCFWTPEPFFSSWWIDSSQLIPTVLIVSILASYVLAEVHGYESSIHWF